MGKVQSIANLIQGVSQQSPQQRRDSQCEAQFDCFNSPLNGCEKRPPTEFVKLWPGRSLAGAFFHEVVRGGENYLTGIHGGQPFAIDLLDGTDCTVAVESGAGYLASSSPGSDFRAQSVEDTTFILNRSVRPAMSPLRSLSRPPEALIFVRAPAFSTLYAVALSGPGGNRTAQHLTPSSEDPNQAIGASTTYIAQILAAGLAGDGYVTALSGSTILVTRSDGQDFAIETSDGNGDDFMYAFKGTVSAFTKLPRKAFPGVLLKVKGENKTRADDFYVAFDGTPSTGSWVETLKPDTQLLLQAASMPHTLVHTGYREFAFRQQEWSTRISGDDLSAKAPSFVGKVVKDIFYHQGRLAILHEAGCVWSKTAFPYTFFPDTVQTLLATAPVDYTLAATSLTKGASLLDYAVQIDEALYLWAPRSQFRVTSGSEPFKQDTVEANPTTAYEYAPGCDPLALGSFLYTASEGGQHATLRSLQFNQGRALGDIDVTSHVSRLIPRGVQGLVASDTLRCLFVLTDGAKDQLFVYNYLLQDRDYAQSAWNVWRIPGGDILWAGLQDNALSILQQRPEGVALLRVNLTSGLVDPIAGATYRTHLDLLVSEAAVPVVYNDVADLSTLTLPYVPIGPDLKVVLRADGPSGYTRGREYEIKALSDYKVSVRGDLRGHQFYVGQRITNSRTESPFYLRSEEGVVPSDFLTVERFRLEMSDTGYTRIEVKPAKGPMKSQAFEGRRLGSASGASGTPDPSDQKMDVKVGHKANEVEITLVNDSFLPSRWQTAAYEYSLVGWSGAR